MSLSPLFVKHTGQESEGESCEILKLWSFLQSKSVKKYLKAVSASGDFIPKFSTGLRPWTLLWTSVPRTPGLWPPNENSWLRHCEFFTRGSAPEPAWCFPDLYHHPYRQLLDPPLLANNRFIVHNDTCTLCLKKTPRTFLAVTWTNIFWFQ